MRGAVATVAGLDAYASLGAIGADDPRTAFVSCGTSGAAIRVLDHVPTEDTVRAAVEMDVTVDRYLDARRMALLGTTPCGLILQPIYDTVGPPEDAPASGEAEHAAGAQAGEPRHGLDAQRAELWQRSYQAVADGQSRLVRTIEPFGEPLDRVVAAGGWMLQAGLRHALERRLRSALQLHADDATAARGAAMLALDTPLDPITAADATFATDNFKAGELIGQWAKGKLGAEAANAKIALLDLNASEVTVDVLRDQGFLQGFGIDVADINDIGDEKDARIVGNDVTDGSEAGGRTAMENLLQKDPGVNLVYTINEPAAAGAYEALKAAGKDKDVTIVSVDGGCPGVENVKAGVIGATSMQFPLKMASLGVDAVVEFSKSGTKPEPSPGLDFFNTGVELISDQPVDGVTSNDSAFGLENCWG
jgi:fructose transport system substrate-binding protein